MPRLDPKDLAVLIQGLPDDELPELLAELAPVDAAAIPRTLSQPVAADLLEAMDPDDATDVVEELPPAEAEQILIQMEPAEAAEIRELLAFPPERAGGLMNPGLRRRRSRSACRPGDHCPTPRRRGCRNPLLRLRN